MEDLLALLKDGRARTKELLAIELSTSMEDIERKLEFLENAGVIKRVSFQTKTCDPNHCKTCSAHPAKRDGRGGDVCKGCMPEEGFKNMGEAWEIENTCKAGGRML